ncbi:hypothetical protein A2U01_0098075, partial [Trifolium medium]|nr:hypothetical protein [Trifolium medium]
MVYGMKGERMTTSLAGQIQIMQEILMIRKALL